MARKRGRLLVEKERDEAHDFGILDQRFTSMLVGSEKQVERNLRKHAEESQQELEGMFRRFRGEE